MLLAPESLVVELRARKTAPNEGSRLGSHDAFKRVAYDAIFLPAWAFEDEDYKAAATNVAVVGVCLMRSNDESLLARCHASRMSADASKIPSRSFIEYQRACR